MRQFNPIDSMPNYQRVAKAIEEEILSGRLDEGAILPTEAELSEQFGVNRSTVREGLRALENAALLKRAGRKRLSVSIPAIEEISYNTSRILSLQKLTFIEMWEMLVVLEPAAAAMAAQRAEPDDLEALQRNLSQMESDLMVDANVIQLDVEFHGLIARASKNRAMVLAETQISLLLYTATRKLYRKSQRARYRQLEAHRKIVEAIAAQDAATAETWMRKHIEDLRRGYIIAGFNYSMPVVSEFDPQSSTQLSGPPKP